MSYNVRIVEEKYSSNYTYNVYNMLQAALEQLQEEQLVESYFYHWSNLLTDSGNEIPNLNLLIKELKSKPDTYKKFNPANGWGDYNGVINWLQNIKDNFKEGYEILVE